MIEIIKEHWLLSIFGTLLVGALGNGLWEWVFKPLLHKSGKLLFIILTFGTKKASDNIYREAARGHHDLPSLFILFIMLFGFVTFSGAVTSKINKNLRSFDEGKETPEECMFYEDDEEKRQCLININEIRILEVKNNLNTLVPVFILLTILLAMVFIYKILAINRINLVITYFQQCLTICKPYMEPNQILNTESLFASMTSKDNFNDLIKDLKSIADANNFVLPTSYI